MRLPRHHRRRPRRRHAAGRLPRTPRPPPTPPRSARCYHLRLTGAVAAGARPQEVSSGEPCVDIFFQIVPGATLATDIAELLDVAWSRNARTALRLVCHLRGVRGLGKANRDGFYATAVWMHARHPRTLSGNLATFARFGYLKDLPKIVYPRPPWTL